MYIYMCVCVNIYIYIQSNIHILVWTMQLAGRMETIGMPPQLGMCHGYNTLVRSEVTPCPISGILHSKPCPLAVGRPWSVS